MNTMTRIFCLSALFATTTAMANPPTTATNLIHEYSLKNGMKLVVKENHRAPTMISQVWYKVGSGFEPTGLSGISHALEHMMFKGTAINPAGTFSRRVAENGGQENAFTSNDYTAYFQKLPADKYSLSFGLEADRMTNLKFNQHEFSKEMEVIKEERRMRVEDDPQTAAYEEFVAKANTGQPYQLMTIGLMNDISHLTLRDLQQWYQKWYAPNNAVLVVVGDVNPQQVYEAANRTFGKLPRKTLPNLKTVKEAAPVGLRQITVSKTAQLPYLLMGFNTPSAVSAKGSWQPYALEMISAILDMGNSSRLSKHLVRGSQVASQIQTSYDLYSYYPGLFTVAGIPAKGHTLEELKNALVKEFEALKTQPIPAAELERVKTQAIADRIYQQDSLYGQAMTLGRVESVGLSWRDEDAYIQRIQAITPEQIQQAARLFLSNDRLTIAEQHVKPQAGEKHAN